MLKPMLAPLNSPIDTPDFFAYVKFPCMLSPKIDGIRGMAQKGVLYSRTLKRIPSAQAQSLFSKAHGLDGELVEGMPIGHDLFNRTTSYIRSGAKEGNIFFYAFDHVTPQTLGDPFIERQARAHELVNMVNNPRLRFIQHHMCHSLEELLYVEDEYLSLGYEGLMIRDPYAPYKTHARSTMNEGYIFKLKRFTDAEGVIVGFKEGQINNNIQIRDERGYASRSKAKEGMKGAGIVGTFLVEFKKGTVKVAPGSFKKDMLKYIWEHRDEFIGTVLKFRYFEFGIVKELRFARALGFRDEYDFDRSILIG
jgi:DNA ligase 1